MLQSQRLQIITEHLQREGSLSIQDLVSMLDVSRETVRSDLQVLEEKGLVERVRGGIIRGQTLVEPAYAKRSVSHREEKRSIAEAAIQLVSDGDTIYVDSGTTLLEFACTLHRRREITVFTNSLLVAQELSHHEIQVYMTGGALRNGEMSLSGPFAEQSVSNVFFDSAFVGAGGVSPIHGITDYHLEEAVLRRAVLGRASRKVVLADFSKYDVTAFVRVVPISEIDILVSDAKFPSHGMSLLTDHGVQVICGN
ncbi:MAG: DeoR/GlpR family DNA-binding transcription regulator [Alicyclobacillus sp.]|nr:DeoR/GlpR family DNA-binding transcription regulator [Alicyclobacillus sp.]